MAQRTRGVDSARRALQILLQFTEDRPELRVDDLSETYGISVPSAYRYVSLLRELNFIEERTKGVFALSPQILQLARAAERTMDYRRLAQPFLDRLTQQTGEMSLYLRRVNDAAVCLAIAKTEHAISISFQPGHMMALHAGAGAKLLLSDYSDARRERYLTRNAAALDEDARERLATELTQIRADGFAESHGEVDSGVWACAAEVRSRGMLVGVISVVAPVYRTASGKQRTIARCVRESAAEMTRALDARSQ